MVRVYTTRAKKSSVFLCFFIKIFSGFSIPRVVNVFIPVFSRVCGIFYEIVSTDSRNRFSRKFRSKNDHPVGFAGWSQGGFSVLGILPDGARALRSKARRQAARALIANADAPVRQLLIPLLPASAVPASCSLPPEAAPRPAARSPRIAGSPPPASCESAPAARAGCSAPR